MSVNQAPSNRVGSTVKSQDGSSLRGRHHRRARVCSAVTPPGASELHPPDGPAHKPNPHSGADHSSSAIPCAAVVHPLSVRVVPARIPSAPSRKPSPRGGVAPHTSARPWMDHRPLSRDAAEPNTSVAQRGDDAWNAGENVAELKLRSEEHTSELQSLAYLVCRLLLEKKKETIT